MIRDVSREREIDEVKSALISTVSHELRTPLTLIHGFAELLVLRDMPAERQRSSAVEILDASRRLARLIDDLLSVSRMESGAWCSTPGPWTWPRWSSGSSPRPGRWPPSTPSGPSSRPTCRWSGATPTRSSRF